MSWFKDLFEGLSKPDYNKMFQERIAKEKKENEIFDISQNMSHVIEYNENCAIEYRLSQKKKREEEVEEKRRQEEKAIDDLKFVIDGAKLKCDLCTNPVGDLKVNYRTPTIQGKKAATVVEKDIKSIIFQGNCKKSPQSSSPCASVMQLEDWKDVGTIKMQDQFPLLQKSTIKCNYGGVDIQITDCGQRCEPTNIDSIFMKRSFTFIGGWTSDYEGMRNLEKDAAKSKSNLGETVYYQLTVSNDIPIGTNITFKLWDEDFGDVLSWFLSDDDTFDGKKVYRNAIVREVNGAHKMTVKLFLNPKWYDDLVADLGRFKNGCLDLYWTWEYDGQPWTSNTNILNVYPSKTTLFIKPAYEGYGFPEIRTADGQLIVFSAGIVATVEPSKELEKIMDTILDDIQNNAITDIREKMVKYSNKLRYSIAVNKLKKGYLVNNLGKIEFSKRLYTKPVFDNSGQLYEITQAVNFGYRKEGKLITTKGISQLDYFKQVGFVMLF